MVQNLRITNSLCVCFILKKKFKKCIFSRIRLTFICCLIIPQNKKLSFNGLPIFAFKSQKVQNLPLTVPSYSCFVTTALPGWGNKNPPMSGKHLVMFCLIFCSSFWWSDFIYTNKWIEKKWSYNTCWDHFRIELYT